MIDWGSKTKIIEFIFRNFEIPVYACFLSAIIHTHNFIGGILVDAGKILTIMDDL